MVTIKRWLIVLSFLFALTACDSNEFNIVPIKKYVIPQNGMYPSLPAKSTFWVKRRPYFDVSAINKGEIIVFHQEKDGKIYDFVWRVIGLPGDKVETRGTDVLINGNLLLHEKKKETSKQVIFMEMNGGNKYDVAYDKVPESSRRVDLAVTVPEANFFLLGDNRDNAFDSRFNGTVPFNHVIGKNI